LIWLVAGTVAAFVIQLILGSPWFGWGGGVLNQLALTVSSLQSGHLWTLATHALLHRTDQPFHILFTVLGLIFIGRELEPILGGRRFIAVYAGALILGGLTWSAIHWLHGGIHIGAGAGILGLFVVLACLYPNQEIGFLFIPVTLRLKYLVYGLLVLDGFGLIFYEIPGAMAPFDYSASAHLGGMLAGWIFFRYFHANNGWDRAPGFALPIWLRFPKKTSSKAQSFKAGPGRTAVDLRAQVDLILDKINSQGFGALTEEEKRILDEAKDMLSRH
jgi:membrane associated rhomboid family serine protease